MWPTLLLHGVFGVVVLGLVADYVTTTRALGVGGQEQNPYAVWLMRHLGDKLGLFVAVFLINGLAYTGVWLMFTCLMGRLRDFDVMVVAVAVPVILILGYRHWIHALHNHMRRKELLLLILRPPPPEGPH